MRRIDEHWTEEKLPNGQIKSTYQRGQNYFDRDAQAYVETPSDLIADDRSAGFSHVNKGPGWKRIGKGGLHRLGFKQGQDATYLPIGASDVIPVVEGNTATYADLWPSVDVSVTVSPERIKETLALRDSAAPHTFAWDVITRGCVLNPSGEYIDTLQGKCVGRIAGLTAYDTNGAEVALTVSVTSERVTVEVGEGAYPITIDPTTVIQPDAAAGIDTYINSAQPTTNFGTVDTLWTYGTTRSLYQFSITGIPEGAVISSASLQLYAPNASGSNVLTANPLSETWNETQATWNNRITGTAWTSAGGTFNASYSATTNANAPGWFSWNIINTVRAWIAGTIPNYGLLLRQTTGTDVIGIDSSDHADTTKRPKLSITWTVLPTQTSPVGTQLAPGKVNDTITPRLSWSVDAAMTQTHYQVQVCDVSDNLKVDSGDVTSGNAYYDVPAGAGLAYGTTYKWRVKISDGSWTAYTDWQYFICVPSAPSDFAAAANSDHARVDCAWTGNATAAGYNVYRRKDGTTDWEKVNISLVSGTTYQDDTAQYGTTFEYTIASVATNGYEGDYDGTDHVTLTFTGSWIGDSQVHLRTDPQIQRPRRASSRVDIRGKHVIQDWGYGERTMDLQLAYKSQAELDAILALFPTDTAVSYRDDLGRVFRGKMATDVQDSPLDVPGKVMGVLKVTLTEVTP